MKRDLAFVASDVHLGAAPPDREAAFHRWLDWVGEQGGRLILNGDLFDFWFEYQTVVPRGYVRTLAALRHLVDAGIPVDLLGGNHDWWGGSFLTDEVGVAFHQEPVRLRLGGMETLVAHGDGLGNGDIGYRVLRTILRGRATRWAFRWIHPDVGAAIARRVSRTEARGGVADAHQRSRADALERWARDRLLEDESLECVLLGHTHLPARVEVAPGRYYLNSGDWLAWGSYLLLRDGAPPALRYWGGEAEPDRSTPADPHRKA